MIKIFIYSFLLGLLFTFASCNENSELTASAIIKKAIVAYGGEANLKNIKSRKEIGTTIIYLNDSVFRTSRYRSFTKSPSKSYYESPINQSWISPKLIFATDGNVSWTQNDGALAPYIQPASETINRKGEDYPYLFSLRERGISVSYQGLREEKGKPLHHLTYTSENGFEEDVYFDEVTGLIAKTYKQIQTSIGPAVVIQLFNDYRKVGSVMIPFRVESQYPPREIDLNIINELVINENVNDSIFQYRSAPILSEEEKNRLVGRYSNGTLTLTIHEDGNELWVKKNELDKTELLVVQSDFFMFRIGENDKSHVENIRITKSGEELVCTYKSSKSILKKN